MNFFCLFFNFIDFNSYFLLIFSGLPIFLWWYNYDHQYGITCVNYLLNIFIKILIFVIFIFGYIYFNNLIFILNDLFYFFKINHFLDICQNINLQTLYLIHFIIYFSICLFFFRLFNNFNIILSFSMIFIIHFIFCNNFYIFFNDFLFLIILLFIFILFILSFNYLKFENYKFPEYSLLILFSLIGILILLYSNDYISLFLGFELQTIPLYILASRKVQKNYSIEAGLKYFILSSFASSLILFGFSFLYGLTGTTNLVDLNLFLSSLQLFIEFPFLEDGLFGIKNFLIFSFFLIFSGLFLKLGLFPFHIWVPDVYEGVPTIITLFFSTIPKIPLLFILIKFLIITLNYYFFVKILILICSVFSIFIGALGAIFQMRIKRILAFSAIHSTGFFVLPLVFLIENTGFSIIFSFFYVIIYILLNFGIFSFLLGFRRLDNFLKLKNLLDLKNLFLINLNLIFIISLLFFIAASIPPFLSFFSKFFIIKLFLFYNYFYLLIIILLITAMSSFYYLRIIQLFFFKIKEKNFLKYSFLIFPLVNIFLILFIFFFNLVGYFFLVGDYVFNDLHNFQEIFYFFQIILTYWITSFTF